MTFNEWKDKAQKYAHRHLSVEPIWSDDDPYTLFEATPIAFEQGQTPEAFIREMFEETFAAQEYDHYLAEESEIVNAEST